MIKIKYTGLEERRVYLKRKEFIVKKGDVFEVANDVAKKFKDKKQFKIMKKKVLSGGKKNGR